MSTMKDVAKEARVSLGTVSNVINGKKNVSEENRRKVLEAVEALDFRVNNTARTLKTNSSKCIGLIIPDITNPFYPEVARGVEDCANKYGYTLFLCNNDRSVTKEKEYAKSLVAKNVDGIILVKSRIEHQELLRIAASCPVILVDTDIELLSDIDRINVDDYEGAWTAMELLYENGHTKIAVISGAMESKSSELRMQAYNDFLSSKGIEIREDYIRHGSYDWYSGYKCTVDFLRLIESPTAIFSANDLMAIGAIKAIRERRLNVPDDISVIGYDDISMASICFPPLTTISQPKYELGRVSVETLIRRIEQGRNLPAVSRVLKTELIYRNTVGRCPEAG